MSKEVIDAVREQYANPAEPVFKMVPDEFKEHAETHFGALGSPEVTNRTLWAVYGDLLLKFRQAADMEVDRSLYSSLLSIDDNPPELPEDLARSRERALIEEEEESMDSDSSEAEDHDTDGELNGDGAPTSTRTTGTSVVRSDLMFRARLAAPISSDEEDSDA